jgi:hypothetical protein
MTMLALSLMGNDEIVSINGTYGFANYLQSRTILSKNINDSYSPLSVIIYEKHKTINYPTINLKRHIKLRIQF